MHCLIKRLHLLTFVSLKIRDISVRLVSEIIEATKENGAATSPGCIAAERVEMRAISGA